MATKKEPSLIPYNEKVRIVRERLRRASRFVRQPEPAKPAKVVAAEKVMTAWEKRCEAAEEKAREKHYAKVREIENALLMGDSKKVIALLDAIGA